jgi:hypothetical protein
MDTTNRSITPTKTLTVLQSLQLLPNTYYYRMESNQYVYPAQHQASSSHCIAKHYIVAEMVVVKEWTQPTRVPPQSRPSTPCYTVYIFFLMQTTTSGWNQIIISTTGPISGASSGHYIGNYIVAETVVVK